MSKLLITLSVIFAFAVLGYASVQQDNTKPAAQKVEKQVTEKTNPEKSVKPATHKAEQQMTEKMSPEKSMKPTAHKTQQQVKERMDPEKSQKPDAAASETNSMMQQKSVHHKMPEINKYHENTQTMMSKNPKPEVKKTSKTEVKKGVRHKEAEKKEEPNKN